MAITRWSALAAPDPPAKFMHIVETWSKRSPRGASVLKRDTYHSDEYAVIDPRVPLTVVDRRPSLHP